MNPLVIQGQLVLLVHQIAVHFVERVHELLVGILDSILHLAELVRGLDRIGGLIMK